MFLYGDTVSILRSAGKRDKFGDKTEKDFHHDVHQVGIDWEASEELKPGATEVDNRQLIVSDVILYVPYGSDILASDHVELPDGLTYKVNGRPIPRKQNPLTGGWTNTTVVKLTRIEG
nr:hypothetical protein [Rhodococcus sp. (in: high G+C Gram-positive bacteria)]